jgi:CubicO group peptidase (beta-lactamase class C family)
MENSTYAQPLTPNYHDIASAAYNTKGEIVEGLWHNYPEQAAAGLWTTPSDLAKYCIEIQEIVKGKTDGILSQETVKAMLTKHKNDWGLGPALSGEGENLLFRHGGKNEGFSNNMIAFANQGNAVIVMTSADNGGKLYGEILRGLSKYYGWEIGYDVKEVEVAVLNQDYLEKLTGKYKFVEKRPDGSDYIVELTSGENQIVVNDSNNGEVDYITPLSKTEFMDISDGDYVKFQVSDTLGFLWNNYYQFYKISDEQ